MFGDNLDLGEGGLLLLEGLTLDGETLPLGVEELPVDLDSVFGDLADFCEEQGDRELRLGVNFGIGRGRCDNNGGREDRIG